MTPFHTHDCKNCTYLGSGEFLGENVDIYRTCEKSGYAYIMRYGDYGDYVTVMESFHGASFEFCRDMERKVKNPNNMLSALITERDSLELRLREVNDMIDFWDEKVTDQILDYGK